MSITTAEYNGRSSTIYNNEIQLKILAMITAYAHMIDFAGSLT